jgi:hypothetical protein
VINPKALSVREGVTQLHCILLVMNDNGIAILVNRFGHEQYPFDSLGKK